MAMVTAMAMATATSLNLSLMFMVDAGNSRLLGCELLVPPSLNICSRVLK